MRNTKNSVPVIFILILFLACQQAPYKQGKVLYEVHCENCHMEDGSGLARLIPSLEQSTIIGSDSLICLIRLGIKINPATGQEMPANRTLNEVEITNIVNFLRDEFRPEQPAIKVTKVKELLDSCP